MGVPSFEGGVYAVSRFCSSSYLVATLVYMYFHFHRVLVFSPSRMRLMAHVLFFTLNGNTGSAMKEGKTPLTRSSSMPTRLSSHRCDLSPSKWWCGLSFKGHVPIYICIYVYNMFICNVLLYFGTPVENQGDACT